jgi:hypothetical protein
MQAYSQDLCEREMRQLLRLFRDMYLPKLKMLNALGHDYFDDGGGTFFPSFRASDRPIAIACFGFVTFFPLRPLFSLPCFIAFISRSTSLPTDAPYLRVALDFFATVFLLAVFLASDFFALVVFVAFVVAI